MVSSSDFRKNWIDIVSPNEPFKFGRRIDWDNISEQDLFNQSHSVDGFFSPDFLSTNRSNVSFVQQSLFEYSELPLLDVNTNELRSFVDLWSPLKICAPRLLLEKYPDLYTFCTDQAISNIIDLLIDRLVDLSDRLLWNQFLLFRKPGAFFTAQIQIVRNQTPSRAVYQDFIFSLRKDSLTSLFTNYPVYQFFVGTIFTHWLDFVCEFLSRLIDDRLAIESTFLIPTTSILSGVEGNLSDPHRFGRTVLILTFSNVSGSTPPELHRLVYKPKSLELELTYYKFLSYLNSTSCLSPFLVLKILSLSTYGYVEYISRDSHTAVDDLSDFYYMLGRLSSVLWVLGCTDLHHENLILSSNQLVLVDAETIFDSPITSDFDSNIAILPTKLESLLFRSLLTCGLLPFWIHYGPYDRPIDISSIGIDSPSTSLLTQDGWLHINTDAMTSGVIEVPSKIPTTLPYEIGSTNVFLNYIDSFISGFTSQSDQLILSRDHLLDSDGIIDIFLGMKRRALIRSTQIYYTVQRQQFLPTALSSFTSQFLVLENLSRGYLSHNEKPNHWPIFHSERHQMINLDIPMFEHNIGSSEFTTSLSTTANLHFPDAHNSVRNRLLNLDSTSISFQLLLIRGSFEAASLHIPEYFDVSSFTVPSFSPFQTDSYTDSISTLAFQYPLSELISSVYYDSQFRCQWLGFNLHPSNVYSFYSLNCSLYSGIASFPSYIELFSQSNDLNTFLTSDQLVDLERIRISTESTLTYWIEQSDPSSLYRWWRDGSLGINGCGGHLLALSFFPSIDIDTFFIPEAFDLCVGTLNLSLLNGCVGLIPALTSIGSSSSLELAHRIANHICTEVLDNNPFCIDDKQFPIGFFHGTSGIASVFSRLYLFSGQDIYLDIAKSALDYERSLFNLDIMIPPVVHRSFF